MKSSQPKTSLDQLLPTLSTSSMTQDIDHTNGDYLIGEETSLADVRMRLKHQLRSERVDIFHGKVAPICAICNRGIFYDSMDMHEALVTRGNVRGNPDLLWMIMVRENTVLVHPGKCHKEAATKEGREKCLNFLIRHEGYEAIREFLLKMNIAMTTNLGSERLSERRPNG